MIEQIFRIPTSDGSLFFLLKIVAGLLCILIGKFYWDRWKFYLLSSKLSGPSGYPFVGSALDFLGRRTEVIYEKCLEYPKLYSDVLKLWIGPKFFLVVSNPEWLEVILNHPLCLNKGFIYDFMKPYLGNGILTSPFQIWKKHRKLMNPAFSQKILQSSVAVFNEQAKILVDVLSNEYNGKPFDIYPKMSSCLVDIICETAMGIKVNTQTTNNSFGKALDRVMELFLMRTITALHHNDFIYSFAENKKSSYEYTATLKNFAQTVISNRRRNLKPNLKRKEDAEIHGKRKFECLLDLLLRVSDEEGGLSDEELNDEVNTIMATGSDTTATATSFCLFTIGMYPEIQAKVYEELIDVMGEDNDPTWNDLTRLRYTDRVIKECLRIFTPVPLISRLTTGDINIKGINVPANTNILLNLLHVHRHPKYWKDPLKFDPDRFLPEEIEKRHPYSHLLFSGGPRSCIGSKFAEMNMKVLLTVILRKFEIKTELKSLEDIKLKVNTVLRPTDGFILSLKPRK